MGQILGGTWSIERNGVLQLGVILVIPFKMYFSWVFYTIFRSEPSPPPLLENEQLKDIGKKYNKSPSQVIAKLYNNIMFY